ncbi:MAG: heavy metal-binding domain-containing protein [Caulobacter sp.]
MLQDRRRFLAAAGAACLCGGGFVQAREPGGYVCPPCGCAKDGERFAASGECPACGMTLVPADGAPPFEPKSIEAGSGAFLAAGGAGREAKRITVQYHRPKHFTPASPVLLVLHGAGRNTDSYRDAWIETSERHGVLIAALGYPEKDYDFAAYHMGGVIKDLVLRNAPTTASGGLPASLHMRDEDILFAHNPHPAEWLFADFDGIFAVLATAAGSTRTSYDLFGHSAGGQILLRLVLFRPENRADRIVAANAGLYTLPDLNRPQLIGMHGTGVTEASLKASLGNRLTLLLGELDNDGEKGGQHLHTPLLDQQGVGRLDRGRYFFDFAKSQAAAMGAPFEWPLQTVPGVAHDQAGMARAAARLFYG